MESELVDSEAALMHVLVLISVLGVREPVIKNEIYEIQ